MNCRIGPVFAFTLFAALLARSMCQAAVFERDWKTPGDGLLTYDDVNKREWLDLRASLLSQFPVPRLNNAVVEIRAGGLFDGFTWATHDEATALLQSAGIVTSSWDYATNNIATSRLIALIGGTYQYSDYSFSQVSSYAFIQPITPVSELPPLPPASPPYPLSHDGAIFDVRFNKLAGEGIWAGAGIGGSLADFFDDNGNPFGNYVGVMLYRNVPEPSSACLVLIAAAGAACMFVLRPRMRRQV